MKKILWLFYQPYKWLIFLPLLVVSTFLFGSLAIILSYIFPPKYVGFICGITWARINAYMTPMFVTVTGRENVNSKKSYVIVSNHQSQYDIFMVYGWLLKDIRWVMKQELRNVPVFGLACEKMGHIYVDRANHAAALESLITAKKKMVNGASAFFFPEGRRSVDGRLLSFKKGAFKMALDLGLPILPVTINGTKDVLPTKTLNLFPGKTEMIIHKEIDINKYSSDKLNLLLEDVKKIIESGLPKA